MGAFYFCIENRSIIHNSTLLNNTAFTLNGFDDQERYFTFVKANFCVSKLKFHACSFKQAFIFFINYILRNLENTKILLHKLSVRYLVVKPACVNAA